MRRTWLIVQVEPAKPLPVNSKRLKILHVKQIAASMTLPTTSLVPRLHPAFQCCTLKSGRAWCTKSHAVRHVEVKTVNVGGINHKISTSR